jgi:hypothetical protein
LARGPPPGSKEEEDNVSTPMAVDVDDCNGGKVKVNGECKGDGNSNGPVDNNNNDNDDVNGDDNDGGTGQKHKRGMIVEDQEEMEVERRRGRRLCV